MENFVLVPVPINLLPPVLALLQGNTDSGAARPIEDRFAPADEHDYSPEQMRTLRQVLKPGSGGFALVDLCAKHPGQEISFTQVMEHAQMPHNKLQGQFSSLTKLAKKHINAKGSWPVSCDWVDRDQCYYTMTTENAKRWQEEK